jgi:hypothetical protein
VPDLADFRPKAAIKGPIDAGICKGGGMAARAEALQKAATHCAALACANEFGWGRACDSLS